LSDYFKKCCLERFKRYSKDFRFVTVDETWIHHYIPEIKEQSEQWTFPDKTCVKKSKNVISWKYHGNCFLEYCLLTIWKKEKQSQKSIMHIIWPIEWSNCELSPYSKEKSALSSRQFTRLQFQWPNCMNYTSN